MFVNTDLTPLEQSRQNEVISVMKKYWNVQKIKTYQLIRDCLKCAIDGNNTFCVLTYEQVL